MDRSETVISRRLAEAQNYPTYQCPNSMVNRVTNWNDVSELHHIVYTLNDIIMKQQRDIHDQHMAMMKLRTRFEHFMETISDDPINDE